MHSTNLKLVIQYASGVSNGQTYSSVEMGTGGKEGGVGVELV